MYWEVLTPIFLTGFLTTMVVLIVRYRHLERMEELRLGAVPQPGIAGNASLLFGLLSVAFGLSMFIPYFLLDEEGSLVAVGIFVFAGAALLLYYRLTEPNRERARKRLEAMNNAASRASAFEQDTREE